LERKNRELADKCELNERELFEVRSSSASRENQLNSDLNESREQIEMLKNELKAAKGRYFFEKDSKCLMFAKNLCFKKQKRLNPKSHTQNIKT
jgi:hypothetical protein